MTQIVTDSASMLPDDIRRRFAISVVPMTITIDDQDFAEGVELATAEFYERLAAGAEVSTAAPSPGSFVDAYRAAAARCATAVLSVHTGAFYSATVASAAIAADMVDIPVCVVDTGVGSFPVALAVWAAAEVLDDGGTIQDAELTPTTVLELANGEMHDRGAVADLDTAIETMIDGTVAVAGTGALRIGVGHAVHPDVAEQMKTRLQTRLEGSEVIVYEVGPSVGAHTGPGTLGVVYTPV